MRKETKIKRKNGFIFAFMCVALILLIGQFTSQSAFGATYYVPDDFDTIQAAVDGAYFDDTIIVRAGTYKGEGNKNILIEAKIITLKSESGPENTIIDCEGDGGGFYFKTVGTLTELNGFKIINGSSDNGGGIRCDYSSPTITNCIIIGNSATGHGGGIHCDHSSPTITNCTITGNSASYDGGGIHCDSSSPTIINCTINGNSASRHVGGIHCHGSSSPITDCVIIGNSATGHGGGIYCYGSSSPITNCLIIGNSASHGGGINCDRCSPPITNCTIIGNSAPYGGGINCYRSSSPITNSILYFNSANEIRIDASAPTVSYSNIMGGWEGEGEGNIDTNPLFVGKADWHLTAESPCIDAGTAEGAPETDLDGNARPHGEGYDMGAYEYSGELPPPLSISGSVITSVTGQTAAIAGATITIEGTNKTTTSDGDGNYEFRDVPTGTYTIKIEKFGFNMLLLNDIVVTEGAAVQIPPSEMTLSGNNNKIGLKDAIHALQVVAGFEK